MTIDFNDVHLQYGALSAELDAAIDEVLSRGVFILGPEVNAFEQEFAAFSGAKHGIGVASGMDAISIALRAIGVGTGDEVVVPALSAAATAMAVSTIGARPVFADISEQDFTMDPASAVDRVGKRTRAIVPVHLYGMPARCDELAKLGPPIVEDAAQAHGSADGDRRCGSIGLAAAFSFYPTKNLGAYGDGGAILTSDPELAERARRIRNYGQTRHYASDIQGVNSRLDELHAAMLRVKLRKLEEWNARRREIAAIYREGLAGLPLSIQDPTGETNGHLFVVRTGGRDALRQFLASKEIPTLIHYPVPLNRQAAFAETDPAPCPVAERVAGEVCSLPIHAHLDKAAARHVVASVREFFEK